MLDKTTEVLEAFIRASLPFGVGWYASTFFKGKVGAPAAYCIGATVATVIFALDQTPMPEVKEGRNKGFLHSQTQEKQL